MYKSDIMVEKWSCIKSTGEQIKPELTNQNTEIAKEDSRRIIQKSIATWARKMHKKMFLHTRFIRWYFRLLSL